ncbi:MAG: type II secretion system F family protein [Vicinamibacterales bacterium]
MTFDLPLVLIGVFASVALGIGALVSYALTWTTPEQRQIRRLAQRGEGVLAQLQLTEAPSAWVKRFQQMVPKSPKDMTRLRRRLATAGYTSLGAAVVYAGSEALLPFVVGGATLIVFGFSKWYFALLGAMLGFVMPSLWLGRQTAARQKQIRNGLPDALDLMIVCIEAGSGIDQAIMKTSDELDITYPALAEEMRLISTEMRAGKPRIEAFKNFATRTKVDEVRSLVSMLVQTDRFGTSIAQALRTHAQVTRTKRRQAAEEKAAKIGVKLVFPLVFCLFPALYIAILGPAVVEYFRLFGQ